MTPEERAETSRGGARRPPIRAGRGGGARATPRTIRERLRASVEEAGRAGRRGAAGGDARGRRRALRLAAIRAARFIDQGQQGPGVPGQAPRLDGPAGADGYGVLADLYWVDDERTRPALLTFLRDAPIVPNLARIVRYLFKVAELREDAEMLGLLTYRFETTRPTGRAGVRRLPVRVQGERTPPPVVQSAYSGKTRNYFRRRAWRILCDRGRLGSPDYVPDGRTGAPALQRRRRPARVHGPASAATAGARRGSRRSTGSATFTCSTASFTGTARGTPRPRAASSSARRSTSPATRRRRRARRRSANSGTGPPRRSCGSL